MPQSLQQYLEFVCWSPMNGEQSMGTPAVTLSMIEFHPQWVKNPPIEGWFSTSSCGHQVAIRPLSFVSIPNSGGNIADSPNTKSGLIIHKKGCLLFASPQPNSTSCCGVMEAMLPKFTYNTELGALEFSQRRHSVSSIHKLYPIDFKWSLCDWLSSSWRGPTTYTRGNLRERASKTSFYNVSNVWITIAEALGALSGTSMQYLNRGSFGSVVWTKLGRSLSRISVIPGIQSITVSKYPFVR